MSTIQLTASQRKFQATLARETGLNSKVIGAWILAEMGGANSAAAQKRDRAHNYNWLNIGYFDSGPGALTKDQVFSDPVKAAKATAQFLRGEKFGASSGIRRILSTKNADPMAQINAIATSGWASSGYNGGASLRQLYQQAPAITPGSPSPTTPKVRVPKAAPGSAPATATQTATSTVQGPPVVVNQAEVDAANEANRKRALVLGMIQRRRPDSLLVRSGALAPQEVPALKTIATQRAQTVAAPATPIVSKQSKQPTSGAAGAAPRGAQAALAWARSTVGVSETNGTNTGPRIDQWQQRFGLHGQYWCAMWTSLAATKGGMAKVGRTPAVREVRRQAMQGSAAYEKGFIPGKQARAGDLILFGNKHIGMVESVGPNGIVMIAGNDSNRVNRRTVAFGSGDIVRPKYQR